MLGGKKSNGEAARKDPRQPVAGIGLRAVHCRILALTPVAETEVRKFPADFGWRLAIRFAFQAAVREPTKAGLKARLCAGTGNPPAFRTGPGLLQPDSANAGGIVSKTVGRGG